MYLLWIRLVAWHCITLRLPGVLKLSMFCCYKMGFVDITDKGG